jgi:archaemetzincin
MKQIYLQILGLLALTAVLAMDFRLPTPAESIHAIGSTEGLPETLQRAFDPGRDFEQIPVPRAGDWLSEHTEPGQPFDDFVKSRPSRPDKQRDRIYLLPLGDFPQDRSPSLETLKEYAASYFVTDVALLPRLSIDSRTLRTRINPITRNRQILTGDVLAVLKDQLPADAFCLLAITMEDLYPDPSWNFVFGQASPREGVGVFSFARYDPTFYGGERGEDYQEVLLRRSCKVLVHEISHMFSAAHCIFYRCVLNGSNHLQESDARPLSLCPVCLRKLQFSIGFDVMERYRKLLGFYRMVGFDREARWVANRLKWISNE